MTTDYLIIGQGICGTFLSWYMNQAGLSCTVIDEQQPNTASVTAAGIINPVTGRRIVKTWLIDDVLPFAHKAYTALGQQLNIEAIWQKDIIDFFPTAQMRQAFLERFTVGTAYQVLPEREDAWQELFRYELGYGIIRPCYLVNLPEVLPVWRSVLRNNNQLLEEKFFPEQLQIKTGEIQYGHITARAVIFCDGAASANSTWFGNLPFAPNKGQMLLIESSHIPDSNIFKRGINLVPWKKNLFWVGSSYEWDFENDLPSPDFRERTEAALRQWLKVPFTVVDHRAARRPATLERRPFVGFHPQYPVLGILNGMGTKGCSLGPFFAKQLTDLIVHGAPLHPDANVNRFERVLKRKPYERE